MIKDGWLIRFTFVILISWCSKAAAQKFAEGFAEKLEADSIDAIYNEFFK